MDRDTANLLGSPDIANSILAKIAMADVFVADVSIVLSSPTRHMPNPNVLVEIGYAVAELGWNNVLLVQNVAFGGPEVLPFDLRGRRTVVYDTSGDSTRAEIRGQLQGRLEIALRDALANGTARGLPSGRDANLWWGKWELNVVDTFGGELFIREVGPTGFLFELKVFHGSHSGQITAYARIVSNDLAYSRIENDEDEADGEIVFRRKGGDGRRIIDIEETMPCVRYRGVRAYFGGRFTKRYEPWFDAGYMNELEIMRLYLLVGVHIDGLRRCTGDIGETKCLDADIHGKAVWGGVAGLYTDMESIVLYDEEGRLWAAYIDESLVRYFTNVPTYRMRLPETIEHWRSRFPEKKIIYCDPVLMSSSWAES
ncbi:hypothetical protein [Herbaspirillum sp. meg3]|uniref:hypothetical protein n=1 Tax=Herbaspirillum sp. meg3 TaxID=2025949 RepID=UPI0012FE49D0|nr:hypothetical protein [Herbaspirillum sp. meg3]